MLYLHKKDKLDITAGKVNFLYFLRYFRSVATLQRFQISSPQYLEKNTVYYMEVLFKQGGGIDQMIVGMRTPSGEMKVPITGDDLIRGISDECK